MQPSSCSASAPALPPWTVHGHTSYIAPSIGNTDANRNCISNIRPGSLEPSDAARSLAWLIEQSLNRRISGISLKDDRHPTISLEMKLAAAVKLCPDGCEPAYPIRCCFGTTYRNGYNRRRLGEEYVFPVVGRINSAPLPFDKIQWPTLFYTILQFSALHSVVVRSPEVAPRCAQPRFYAENEDLAEGGRDAFGKGAARLRGLKLSHCRHSGQMNRRLRAIVFDASPSMTDAAVPMKTRRSRIL